MTRQPARRLIGRAPVLLTAVLLVTGCAGAAGDPASTNGGSGPGAAAPGAPGASPIQHGGGTGSDPGDGTIGSPVQPGGGAIIPGQPKPSIVEPRPGRLNPHDVGISMLEARVEGRHVWIRASWWSGVAPCSVLDSATAEASGQAFTVRVREGADVLDSACIDIAQYKATVIDLGELEAGTYTVRPADGDAQAITVDVS